MIEIRDLWGGFVFLVAMINLLLELDFHSAHVKFWIRENNLYCNYKICLIGLCFAVFRSCFYLQ